MTATLLLLALMVLTLLVVVVLVLPREARRSALVVLAVVAVVAATSVDAPTSVSLAAQGFAALLLSLSLVVGPFESKRLRSPLTGAALAFLVLSVVTTAAFEPAALGLAVRIGGLEALTAVAVSQFRSHDVARLTSALIGLACVEAVLGILEALVLHQPFPWGRRVVEGREMYTNANVLLGNGFQRVEGTLGHAIPFATLLTVAACLLVRTWSVRGPHLRWIAMSLCVAGLVLSGSRTGVLGLGLCFLLLILTSRSTGRGLRVVTVTCTLAGATALFWNDVRDIVARTIETGSYTNRSSALDSVPGLVARPFREALLGSGWGSELDLYARGLLPQNGFTIVDNQFVTTLATTGVVGAGLLTLLFLTSFVAGDRTRRALLVLLVVMVFSFDFVAWASIGTLCFLCLCTPWQTAAPSPGQSERAVPSGPCPSPGRRIEVAAAK
ncbi:O-antigen ligase family protein [Frondihabitans cladoniiphilus]|uniref:O-antigen ligase-related domain-containing protein n=1 Tax=Frondihabitans cladoniiphilus TaxID=715785 RepID=A0ABP8W1K8_9MICO